MESKDVTTELTTYMRDVSYNISVIVRAFGELVGSLDVLNESVDRIASAVEEIRNLQNLKRQSTPLGLKRNGNRKQIDEEE
jgi:uncharacterized protein Yka (UPF0111/DUF47 family)